MQVKGLELPEEFVTAIQFGRLAVLVELPHLRVTQDAFGNPLEIHFRRIFTDAESLMRETEHLEKFFQSDGEYGVLEHRWQNEPGHIPDVVDFSLILCFGISERGTPFCLDFRDDLGNPSVICWDEVYWRRVARDFRSFMALFNL